MTIYVEPKHIVERFDSSKGAAEGLSKSDVALDVAGLSTVLLAGFCWILTSLLLLLFLVQKTVML